jgi:hypothetical protein
MGRGVCQGAPPDRAFPEDDEPSEDGNDWGSEAEEDDGFEECIEVIGYPN